jgi:hypothetical protein
MRVGDLVTLKEGSEVASLAINDHDGNLSGVMLNIVALDDVCIILLIDKDSFEKRYWVLTPSGHIGWTYHDDLFRVV